MIVQAISSGVLWVVRDGVGLARALNRTITMPSRIITKTAIAVVIQNKNVLNQVMSSMIGVAESCKIHLPRNRVAKRRKRSTPARKQNPQNPKGQRTGGQT